MLFQQNRSFAKVCLTVDCGSSPMHISKILSQSSSTYLHVCFPEFFLNSTIFSYLFFEKFMYV